MKDLTLQEQTELNGGFNIDLTALANYLNQQQAAINALNNLTGTSDDYHR